MRETTIGFGVAKDSNDLASSVVIVLFQRSHAQGFDTAGINLAKALCGHTGKEFLITLQQTLQNVRIGNGNVIKFISGMQNKLRSTSLPSVLLCFSIKETAQAKRFNTWNSQSSSRVMSIHIVH